MGQGGDASLAARLRAGDELALAEAYDANGAVVFGLAARVSGDRAAAEDLTQDVFVWLWEHPDAYDPARGSLRAFLATVVRRRAIDWIRSTGSRRRREEHATPTGSPPDPSDEVARVVMTTELRSAVERLPVAQREALDLAYYGGLTYREVAERLDIPEGTAKTRLRSALATLSTQMRGWTR
ncbi:MAG: sigma-70 family RNA polymerase sigma factor [Actinomycetota bacterium]